MAASESKATYSEQQVKVALDAWHDLDPRVLRIYSTREMERMRRALEAANV